MVKDQPLELVEVSLDKQTASHQEVTAIKDEIVAKYQKEIEAAVTAETSRTGLSWVTESFLNEAELNTRKNAMDSFVEKTEQFGKQDAIEAQMVKELSDWFEGSKGDNVRAMADQYRIKKWVIVFACCWINMAVYAMLKSSGVLYRAILETFKGSTSSEASWPTTLINSVSAIASLPAGFLTHYYTERSLVSIGILITASSISLCYFSTAIFMVIFLIGFTQGLGLGLIFGPLTGIITQYFDRESRSAAVGVSFAGSTIGSIFSPLIFDQLLQSFSFHQSCLIMGISASTSMIGAVLLTPHPQSPAIKSTGVHRSVSDQVGEDVKVFKNPKFLLICLSYSIHYFSSITVMMMLNDYAIQCGLSNNNAVLLLSMVAVGNLTGRLSPLLTNLIKMKKFDDKTIYIVSMVLLPLIYVLFPILSSVPNPIIPLMAQFTILALLIGYFSSYQLILAPVLLAEFLGSSKTAVTFGLVNLISGLVSFTRPLIIAVITGNNYNASFYTFAIFPLISAAFWIYTFCVKKSEPV